jgi:tetratricopeptide (TPR) repeat protein
MPQVSVQSALRLAQQHRDAGRFRNAETIYREIIAQRPDHAESPHQLGLLAYHEGRHADAIEPLRQAIALKPGAYLRALEIEPDRAELCQSWLGEFLKNDTYPRSRRPRQS